MIDVVAIPDRFEQHVREPEREHVLDRFLAEIVIDTIDLPLRKDRGDCPVQFASAQHIATERFFHDDPVPSAGIARVDVLTPGEIDRSEVRDDVIVVARGRREIKKTIAAGAPFIVEFDHARFQAVVGIARAEIGPDIEEIGRERFP